MKTEYYNAVDNKERAIERAVELLKFGEVVAIPTETVYGLAANGLDESACLKIFTAKRRPADNPLILHISHLEELTHLIQDNGRGSELIKYLWPGPLTLIYKKSDRIPNCVCAGGDTVAIRMPSHPVAREIIKQCKFPLAAPSANISGKPSPTNGKDVLEDMDGVIAGVIDGGDCNIGVESTVVDLSGNRPKILRPGYYSLEDLKEYLPDVEMDNALLEPGEIPKSPGQKYRHYAPKARVEVYFGNKDKIHQMIHERIKSDEKTGLLLFEDSMPLFKGERLSLGDRNNPVEMGKVLFSHLREMDRKKMDLILIEFEKTEGFGIALYNRLLKASGGNIFEVKL